MPLAPLVFKIPLMVVVPLPADWMMLLAVIFCVLILLALVNVRTPTRVVPPILSRIEMSPPPALSVRLLAPLTVLERVIFCDAAEVSSVAVPASVIGPPKVMPPPAATCPARNTAEPDCVKAPDIVETVPEAIVKTPEPLFIVNGPADVVVMLLLIVKAVPVRLIPPAPVVLTVPLNIVEPLPVVWMMAPADIAFAVTLPAEAIEREASGVTPPTAPTKKIFPVPALRDSA